MKTTKQSKVRKKESNGMNHLEDNSLLFYEMLMIKGGDGNDTDDTSGGSDDQEDGFN